MRITPARLAGTYVAVAATWILLSDTAVEALGLPSAIETQVNIAKGWGFVLFTGMLLLLLARLLVGQVEHRERRLALMRGELAERESRLAAILDASPNPIFTIDGDGAVRYANPAAGQAFGAGAPGLAGRSIHELVPNEMRDRHPDAVRAWFARGESAARHPIHVRARRVDGSTFPVEVLLAPVVTPDGPLAIVTLVDLSEREALEARIRQGERLETLGQFAGILAHDIRNYLMAVNWSAEMLAQDLGEADARYADVDLIRRAAAGGLDMTRSVLDFARPTNEVAGRTELPAHLAQVVSLIRPLVEPTVSVHVDCPDAIPPVAISPQSLTQVLVNLATNARDAMPDGGSLAIVADEVEAAGRTDGLLGPGPHVRIRVTDTGTGMDAATREHAFDAFYTTRSSASTDSGTGLGLSSAYLIVTRAGGTVDIASAPGAGTTITIHLPVSS